MPRDQLAKSLRQGCSPSLDTDQTKVIRAVILFNDLVRQANQGPLDLRGGHDSMFFAQGSWWGRYGICHKALGAMIRA